jgi:hypothetical protein
VSSNISNIQNALKLLYIFKFSKLFCHLNIKVELIFQLCSVIRQKSFQIHCFFYFQKKDTPLLKNGNACTAQKYLPGLLS